VHLDGVAAGLVTEANVADVAFLFEHPRPFNKAEPWSWALVAPFRVSSEWP
jgi:hypothetical protein